MRDRTPSGTLRLIDHSPPTESAGKDHALVLHRFVGGVQIFGGVTLVAAYSLGAESLDWSAASGLLVFLGLVQIATGITWIARARQLRGWLLRRPGTFVVLTLAVAVAVTALGGSNADRIYITSTQCWLVAAGWSLQGWRVVFGTAACLAVVVPIWALVDGKTGGYDQDGVYATAFLGLVTSVLAGLWLGRTTGAAAATLNRWHLVETHELGLVDRLRANIAEVDRRASALASSLPGGSEFRELASLRARLRLGVGASERGESVGLDAILADLAEEHELGGSRAALRVEAPPAAATTMLAPVVADALVAVVRRQLNNVVRHAPGATTAWLKVELTPGHVRVRIEDDGAGDLPFRAGTGTAWSVRQLARVGGHARYYAGERGVGFEVHLPVEQRTQLPEIDGLSIGRAMDRFGAGMLGALRWVGYVGDSIGAQAVSDDIGLRWLLMPVGAGVIELLLWRGAPLLRSREARTFAAAMVAVGLVAVFSIPADSPSALVPATVSVVIIAHLIYLRRPGLWAAAELMRLVAAAPLLERYGAATVGLVIIYPAGMYMIVLALTRFQSRARSLEDRAADAMGRAGLASAAVRGLALRHDAVDVLARTTPSAAQLSLDVQALDGALSELDATTSGVLDPFAVIVAGLEAALDRPVLTRSGEPAGEDNSPAVLAGAIDRITLIELAALAADERSSCAPPGALGRRRLDALEVERSSGGPSETLVTLEAHPTLALPDAAALDRLQAVAEVVGVTVVSTPISLTLRYSRS